MIQNALRKIQQLRADSTLRAWLIGRAFGKWSNSSVFTPHQPPYLSSQLPLLSEIPTVEDEIQAINERSLSISIDIALPGETITLSSQNPGALFDQVFDDIETELGAHRFAWLDHPGVNVDPNWTAAIWQIWVDRFGGNKSGWAWHPYTATERAINILNFASQYGWPGDADQTRALIAAHAPAIARQLEYFGEHNTSNHLANNGRGLFTIGAMLELPNATEMGMDILVHEAARIFMPSGILRENSSHYHALYARRYQECAMLAHKKSIKGADQLSLIADRAMDVLAHLRLPGGMPLVGDISPDITPSNLLATMDTKLSDGTFSADGWLRVDQHDWHGLWHCAPAGWSEMPGHGHQDVGSFELHWRKERVIVDPGRGRYGETGEASHYRSAEVHNGLTIDGHDPYPPNKPYYTSAFRESVCGMPPTLACSNDDVRLEFDGYTRLNQIGRVTRNWAFDETIATITDAVAGKGHAKVCRQFVTPLAAKITDDGVILIGINSSFIIRTSMEAKIQPITIWHAYGHGEPGSAIVFDEVVSLPWQDDLMIEVI